MKAETLDYVLSTALITVLLALAALPVWALSGWIRQATGDYHVVIDLSMLLIGYGLVSAVAVRTMVRLWPLATGAHGMDSAAFTYWKLLTVAWRLGQGALRPFVPFFLRPVLDALFGARVGRDVAFGGSIDDPFLVSVGDRTVLGNASLITGNYLNGGLLHCAPVRIGAGVVVGANAIVMPGTSIGDNAVIMAGACLMPGAVVPAGETWRGNPARKWL